jgi:NAD-dependent DNA ligase
VTPVQQVAAAPARGGGGGYIVVFTGVRDKTLEAQLLAAGHVVTDSVTKKTTHVVHPDGVGTPMTTKVIKAQQLGCAVLSITEFRALVK